jgi:predicted Zn-dependent peptidase
MGYRGISLVILLVLPQSVMGVARRSRILSPTQLSIPVQYYHLSNGLKVVLSPQHNANSVSIAIHYRVGFRTEPERTPGIAHLVEHLFLSSPESEELNAVIERTGGQTGAYTRYESTEFFDDIPSQGFPEVLRAEANRMSHFRLDESTLTAEKHVVANEIRELITDRAYGGLASITVPMHTYSNWPDAHDPYGLESVKHITLGEALSFYKSNYTPDNAAISIVGSFNPNTAKKLITKYFADIDSGPPHPGRQHPKAYLLAERQDVISDALAPLSAIAVSYAVPEQWTDDFYAFLILNQLLLHDSQSLLLSKMVTQSHITPKLLGGINPLGTLFDYQDPMLWTVYFLVRGGVSPQKALTAFNEAILRCSRFPLRQDDIDRAKIATKSDLLEMLSINKKDGRANTLASLAVFDQDPTYVNRMMAQLDFITVDQVSKVAQKYLSQDHQSILIVMAHSSK